MAQKYYEYSHYKEQDEQGPQQRPPRGSHAPYLLVFQAIFYSFFHVSAMPGDPGGRLFQAQNHILQPIPQSFQPASPLPYLRPTLACLPLVTETSSPHCPWC